MASSSIIPASAVTQPAAPQTQHCTNTAPSPCHKPDEGSTRFPPVDPSKPYVQLLMNEPHLEPKARLLHARQCRKALRVLSAGQLHRDWKTIPVFEDDFSDGDEQDDRDGEAWPAPASPADVTDSEPDEAPSPKRKLSITAAVRCDSPPKRAVLVYEPGLNLSAF